MILPFTKIRLYETPVKNEYVAKVWYHLFDGDDVERIVRKWNCSAWRQLLGGSHLHLKVANLMMVIFVNVAIFSNSATRIPS